MSTKAFAFVLILAMIFVCGSFLSAQEKPKEGEKTGETEAIVITQTCNGFPGTDQNKKKTEQKVIIKSDKIYMENMESPNICIVRSDKKLIWEIDTKDKGYTERRFSYFTEHKKAKESDRARLVKMINATSDQKRRKELAEKLGYILDKNGKVPDKIAARTELTGEEKEINGFKCYRVKIYEDAKTVLDVWLTKAFKAPKSLMNFYKQLGCFADEVVAEMEKLQDFPILLKADLNLGAISVPIESEITKIEKKVVDDKKFEKPEGLIPIKTIDGKKVKWHIQFKCEVCGKNVDPNATGDKKPYTLIHDNVKYLFDSKKCKSRFIKELAKEKDIMKVRAKFAKERAQNKNK